MDEVAVIPEPYVLTDGQRDAIKRARFKTVNMARTEAIVYDADRDLMAETGLSFAAYTRAKGAPFDHEARSHEPVVIEFVASPSR